MKKLTFSRQVTLGMLIMAICLVIAFVAKIEVFQNIAYAAVYDGYAPRKEISFAYYSIPENVPTSIMSYLRQNGILREMGDGAIGMGTFNH